jgi:hypothetical protein
MTDFKNYFFQHKDKSEAIKKLYDEYRPEDYSFWHLHYDKYEGEGEKIVNTSNLLNGFL